MGEARVSVLRETQRPSLRSRLRSEGKLAPGGEAWKAHVFFRRDQRRAERPQGLNAEVQHDPGASLSK